MPESSITMAEANDTIIVTTQVEGPAVLSGTDIESFEQQSLETEQLDGIKVKQDFRVTSVRGD